MFNRATEEVAKEIERLRALKPRVRQYSRFGDDNHAAIEAQIAVLEEGLDDTTLFDQGWNQYQESAGQDAYAWAMEDEDESPADGWEPIAN